MADFIITDALGSAVTPTLITGLNSQRASGNIVHRIIGRPSPEITLKPTLLRAGTLEMLFTDEATAADAAAALATPTVFDLTCESRPTLSMRFVVSGQIGNTLDPDTRNNWTVSVDYQEVS